MDSVTWFWTLYFSLSFPKASELEDYEILPDFGDIDITKEVIKKVAWCLSGSAGPGGLDAQSVQQWLLRFGGASQQLCKAICKFVVWLANDFLTWAAYRALKAGQLVALDSCPGIWPIGIGQTWNCINAQCVLLVSGGEAKDACGIDQLCAGFKAGIECSIQMLCAHFGKCTQQRRNEDSS